MAESTVLNWTIDGKFKKKLNKDDARFILDEAEKSYNDTIETSLRILDRNSTLLTLVASIIVGLVAYSIAKWEKSNVFDGLIMTALTGIVYYLCLGLFLIFPNIKPNVYILPGTQPKKLFIDAIFDFSDDDRLILLYITKITNIQQGIETNRNINNKRWGYYKKSLDCLFYSPIILILIYVVLTFISK